MKTTSLLLTAGLLAVSGAALAHDMSPKAPNIKGTHYHLELPSDWVNHNRFALTPMYSFLKDANGDSEGGYGIHLNYAQQFGRSASSVGFDLEAKYTTQTDDTNTDLETQRLAAYLTLPLVVNPSFHITPKLGAERLTTSTSGAPDQTETEAAFAISLDGRAKKNIDYQFQVGSTKENTNVKLQFRFNVGKNFRHAVTTTLLAEEYGEASSTSFGVGYQFNLAR